MKFIVKLFPEIMIKSDSVRLRFAKILTGNIRNVLKKYDETLAVVRASNAAIERANQVAQTAELKANLDLARKRVARLEQLEGTVAQKDIDAARAEAALQAHLAGILADLPQIEADHPDLFEP